MSDVSQADYEAFHDTLGEMYEALFEVQDYLTRTDASEFRNMTEPIHALIYGLWRHTRQETIEAIIPGYDHVRQAWNLNVAELPKEEE